MNRILTTTALAALAALGLTACTPKTTPVAATPAATTASPTSASPSPAESPSPRPSASRLPSPPPKPVALGPAGYGRLKIGLSPTQAYATGLITKTAGSGAGLPSCALSAGLVGSGYRPGGTKVAGWVLFGEHGVAAIYAYGNIATPEGIHLGSTTADVTRAYPKGAIAEGRMNVAADSSGRTEYRIALSGGKVVELAVQARPNGCYE